MEQQMNITGVLDRIDEKTEGERMTVGDIVDALGSRGYGPLLVAAALIEILPTGAIPGVPTLVAVVVILLSAQLVAGRSSPWLPQKLSSKSLSRNKFEKGRKKIRPATQKIDRAIKPRLSSLTTPTSAKMVGVLCIVLALTMPPLEFVPFASSAPAAAIAILGVGLAARDGLIVLIGLIAAAAGLAGAVYWLAF